MSVITLFLFTTTKYKKCKCVFCLTLLCVVFQAAATTDRAGELHNSTTNTHQRAHDLLAFINNVTMDINGRTSKLKYSFHSLQTHEESAAAEFQRLQTLQMNRSLTQSVLLSLTFILLDKKLRSKHLLRVCVFVCLFVF